MIKIKRIDIQKLLLLVFLLVGMSISITAMAADTKSGTERTLIDNVVGRYRLTYIGNTNHYANWNTNGTFYYGQNYIYNDPKYNNVYTDSSTAKLSKSKNGSRIKYAYLVWETRAPEGVTTKIGFITPNGKKLAILPQYAVNDWRDSGNGSWAYSTMYCMATDVTEIVRNAGYGDYSVCNIPRWDANNYKDGNGITPGGESPGSWQLIIVEENDGFPISVVHLSMGAEFKMAKNYSGSLSLVRSGLKSKASGMATGQIFFGASNSSPNAPMTENVTTYDNSGTVIKPIVSNTTYKAGLYRNGNQMPGNDRNNNGCIRMSLSDVNDIGNRAQRIDMQVENQSWTTFFFLGLTADIAVPDFEAGQETTVNSSTNVTVTGHITNVSGSPDTGIYDGRLVIMLDDALLPTSMEANINGVNTISGRVAGNTVIFDGDSIKSMMPGDTIRYRIECTTSNSGKTQFLNSDQFSGKLRSDGVNTGKVIDRIWSSFSQGTPKYRIAVNAGTGIESVIGAGEYEYNTAVKLRANLLPGYHWASWTGDISTAEQELSFQMPNGNRTFTANGEANVYTIEFNANGGTGHINNITAQFDTDVALPDGASDYMKYTLDGINVTEDVISGKFKMLEPEALEEPEISESPEEADELKAADTLQQDVENLADSMESEETAIQKEQVQKFYPSVFMGWSLEDEKDVFTPKWKTGDRAKNLTEENNGTITLYAVWDDCPWIQAEDLYYSLEQARGGYITENEILSHAAASDREDGTPIEPGFHDNGTSFSIPVYQEDRYTQIEQDGDVTEILTAVDSVGSIYSKQITVHIVDTAPQIVKPEGTTRFIDEYYYSQPYANGGLEDDSIWKKYPEYKAVLESAFDNSRNGTPEEVYYFSHEDVLNMKKFAGQNESWNSKDGNVLSEFYDKFMKSNKVK